MAITKTTTYYQGYAIDTFTGAGTMSWTTPVGVTQVSIYLVGGGGGSSGSVYSGYSGAEGYSALSDVTGVLSVVVGLAGVAGFGGPTCYGTASSFNGISGAGGVLNLTPYAEGGVGYTRTVWDVSITSVGAGGRCSIQSAGTDGIVMILYSYIPVVITDEITLYTEASCVPSGSIVTKTTNNITRRGFCYIAGTSGDPTIADTKVYTDTENSFEAGSFYQLIPDLLQGTGYRIRAFATNVLGTGYGTTKQLTTIDAVDGSAGTTSWLNIPYFAISTAEFRGAGVFNNKLYMVVGENVLSVTTGGISTSLGQITTSTGRVFLAYNGTQILIVDGTVYGHYVLTSNDSLNNITDGDFPSPTSCCFMDGYFIVTVTGSGRFYISGLYDAATWDALDYATAEGDPDNTIRCFHANGNLWLFGLITTEVWYNSGNADFPFSKVQGALIEDGIAGASAVALIKDQFYFLSHKFEVLRTVGYQREKISTTYIDKEIQSYTVKSDASAYEYRLDGHIFFVLTFPTADKTWVYDITTDFWHEWQSYKTAGVATYGRHRGNLGFYFNGKYYIGDYATGYIYELSTITYTDSGELIKRIRRSQIINKERLKVAHHSVEIDIETGVGTAVNPILYLRWSDDNGNTWSNSYGVELGLSGDYSARAIWRRLGMSRNRIYELTYTQPTKFILLSAYADLEQENA